MRTRNKIIFLMLLILLGSIIFYLYVYHRKPHTVITNQPKSVLTWVIQPKSINEFISTNGYIQPIMQTNIQAKTSGYIESILINEGEHVTKGQTLVILDNKIEQQDSLQKKADVSLALSHLQRLNKIKQYTATQDIQTAQSTYKQKLAQYKSSLSTLADRTIKAPFSGIIGSIDISRGNFIDSSTVITTLSNTNNLKCRYSIAFKYYNQTKLGAQVSFTSVINPKNKAHATVTFKAKNITQDTQTFVIDAHFKNVANQFSPGEAVLVSQKVNVAHNKIIIPTKAIYLAITGDYVYVVNTKTSQAKKTYVKLGSSTGDYTEIISGLSYNQHLITSNGNIRDGIKVSWQ